MMCDHLRRMARYNRWANDRLYAACAALTEDAYRQSRQAYFGSIHGTLNHILVADRIWLARICEQASPGHKLDDELFSDLGSLKQARIEEDRRMIDLTESYGEAEIGGTVRYRMVTKPEETTTPLHLCWLHLFNHQTHHRGQIHDQLSQTNVAPPSLDLLYYVRAEE